MHMLVYRCGSCVSSKAWPVASVLHYNIDDNIVAHNMASCIADVYNTGFPGETVHSDLSPYTVFYIVFLS